MSCSLRGVSVFFFFFHRLVVMFTSFFSPVPSFQLPSPSSLLTLLTLLPPPFCPASLSFLLPLPRPPSPPPPPSSLSGSDGQRRPSACQCPPLPEAVSLTFLDCFSERPCLEGVKRNHFGKIFLWETTKTVYRKHT